MKVGGRKGRDGPDAGELVPLGTPGSGGEQGLTGSDWREAGEEDHQRK
jgi:hypothetical protein